MLNSSMLFWLAHVKSYNYIVADNLATIYIAYSCQWVERKLMSLCIICSPSCMHCAWGWRWAHNCNIYIAELMEIPMERDNKQYLTPKRYWPHRFFNILLCSGSISKMVLFSQIIESDKRSINCINVVLY